VVRAVTLLSLLAAVAVGGYLFVAGNNAAGPTSPRVSTAEQQGVQAAASVNLQQAAAALEANRASTGSYAGTSLSGYGDVLLVRADASSYCVQSGSGATTFHLAGPGGSPAAGGC
jgi:putative hemolysin